MGSLEEVKCRTWRDLSRRGKDSSLAVEKTMSLRDLWGILEKRVPVWSRNCTVHPVTAEHC